MRMREKSNMHFRVAGIKAKESFSKPFVKMKTNFEYNLIRIFDFSLTFN